MAKVVFAYGDQALASLGATVAASSVLSTAPAANVVNADRDVYWRTTGASGTVTLDVDLGAARSIGAVAVCNLQFGTVGPNIDVLSGSSSPGTTSRATVTSYGWADPTVRDWCEGIYAGSPSIITPVSARYWRFSFSGFTGDFQVGKVILGTGLDLLRLYSQGSSFTIDPSVSRTRTAYGRPVDFSVGLPRKRFNWIQRTNSDVERAALQAIAAQTHPFALQDSTGFGNHVVLESFQFTHVFDLIWDVQLTMEQMP